MCTADRAVKENIFSSPWDECVRNVPIKLKSYICLTIGVDIIGDGESFPFLLEPLSMNVYGPKYSEDILFIKIYNLYTAVYTYILEEVNNGTVFDYDP